MNNSSENLIPSAEHAITLMLALAREIPQADASTQAGKWEKNRFMGVEITAKTLGVIGCGNIGSIVADRALGLRMKVLAFDPFLSPERAKDIGVEKVDLDDLFKRADFITLHTPLTEKTKNIINAAALAKMKKGVRIINCARGGLVDEQALVEALNSAALSGLLRPMLGDVNVVSAPVVAKERGMVVDEIVRAAQSDYESLITVTVTTERQERSVSGTVYADGKPRLVDIKGIRVDAEFGKSMIYVTNEDKPGFIGHFAGLLGDAKINIATFHLGRNKPGGDAIALVEVDGAVPADVVARVQAF